MFYNPKERNQLVDMGLITVAGILLATTVVLSMLTLGVLSVIRRLNSSGGRPEPPNANRARRNIPGGSDNSD